MSEGFFHDVGQKTVVIDDAVGERLNAVWRNVAVAYKRSGVEQNSAGLAKFAQNLKDYVRIVVITVDDSELVGSAEFSAASTASAVPRGVSCSAKLTPMRDGRFVPA